ncbi:MAG: CcmD family protein [Dehalococcoidia bacterium]
MGILLQSQPPANLPFLFAAFAVVWVAFFVYAFFVARRRQEMQRELDSLRQSLEQPESAAGDSPTQSSQ